MFVTENYPTCEFKERQNFTSDVIKNIKFYLIQLTAGVMLKKQKKMLMMN